MLDALLTPTRESNGRYTLDIQEGWRQGRGAFGGLVLGALARATMLETPDRALRSLTAALPGPTQASRAEIAVEILRAGSGVTTSAARLVQGGEVQAHAVVVLGRARDGALDRVDIAPPEMPPWRQVAPIEMSFAGPEFAQHYEFRCTGPLPFSGGAEPLTHGWIRPRAPAKRDAAWLVACADAWWPSLFSTMTAPRPMATVSFTFDAFDAPPQDDAPLFHRARLLANKDGHAVELRELWSESGKLLALNHQTFVVIR